jgi:hypothetical protein
MAPLRLTMRPGSSLTVTACAAELIDLRSPQVEKLRHLRRLKRRPRTASSCFVTERGRRSRLPAFAKMVERLGGAAGFKFGVYPYMLRHAADFKLADEGHDTRSPQAYLGHETSSIRCATANCRLCAIPRTSEETDNCSRLRAGLVVCVVHWVASRAKRYPIVGRLRIGIVILR